MSCSEALAEDGYRVVLADINEAGVTEAATTIKDAVGLVCDMGDPTAITAMFDKIEADIGPVTALVNDTGVAMPGDFLEYDLEIFNKVIAINLNGVFRATQHAGPDAYHFDLLRDRALAHCRIQTVVGCSHRSVIS